MEALWYFVPIFFFASVSYSAWNTGVLSPLIRMFFIKLNCECFTKYKASFLLMCMHCNNQYSFIKITINFTVRSIFFFLTAFLNSAFLTCRKLFYSYFLQVSNIFRETHLLLSVISTSILQYFQKHNAINKYFLYLNWNKI